VRLVMLLLVALSGLFAVGCSPAPRTPVEAGAQARQYAKLGYAIGATAVSTLGNVLADWEKSLDHPTPEQLAVADKVLAGLDAAKAALGDAKPWIETGQDEAAGKKALRSALDIVATAGDALVVGGVKVPDSVMAGLDAAREALGGGQ
jgi:hypothetical protein